ncbi:MAG TPA: diguanylate cyclase [Phycisphaeraceae bacterium]|nr:diguanylate cyclase [Phycisphaeraceae bacterium]
MTISPPDNAKLLLIEDSPQMQRLLSERLGKDGIKVYTADNGLDGIGIARSKAPDLILLAIDLPGMDGFEVLQILRDDESMNQIPVIVLTEHAGSEEKVKAFEMGAMDIVSKPPDMPVLRARVRSALRISLLMKMLAQRAQLDGLTGLWNRAYIDTRLREEVAQSLRHGRSLSLIIGDLDEFKKINDTYGHPHGDEVLQTLARLLKYCCREGDIPCRYGGEEFAIILPGTEASDAAEVAERIRTTLADVCWCEHPEEQVTASFGVASLGQLANPTVDGLIAAADRALYTAKSRGRNCVVVAQSDRSHFSLSA